MQVSLLESAIQHARQGYPVFPITPRKKKPPLVKPWQKKATTDEETIRGWWDLWPEANIGIPTGKQSGIICLDVDGPEAKKHLKDRANPPTPMIETGRPGGIHRIYRYDPSMGRIRNHTSLFGRGSQVDVRGEGGYIVAPGSVHPNGNEYTFYTALDWMTTKPVDPPDWLIEETRPDEPDEVLEETIEHLHDGKIISPLFKASAPKYGDLGPLEPPDRHSGQRNRWLFEQALTHFNLGLDYDYFRAVFYQKVWPKMDKGPGQDGERFTADEANRTIKSARRYAKKCGALPASVVRYHTYREKSDTKDTKEYNRGPTRWSTFGLKQACLGFFSRHQELEYRSGEDGRPCLACLLDELQEWVKQHWPNKKEIPRRSLCRVLGELQDAGILEKDVHRQGSGHVVMRLEMPSKKQASVPTSRSTRGDTPETVKNSARASASVRSNRKILGREPPKTRQKPPDDMKQLLKCGTTVPDYPYLEQLIKNAGMTMRPAERKTCHKIAWITDDPGFATWVCRQFVPEVIGPVLNQLHNHFDDIDNVGAWMRCRLNREQESSPWTN
jgi:hypothetical protein